MKADPTGLQGCLTQHAHGITLTVKARPGINRPRAPQLVAIGDAKTAIEITVAAAPEDGKANQAILSLVAKALRVKSATLDLKSGHTSRIKVITVTGDPHELSSRVVDWLNG